MKKLTAILAVLAFVAATVGIGLAAEATELNGSFVWERTNDKGEDDSKTGDLKAIFVEGEAGKWKVDFHFTWEKKPRVWSGTAEGSLSEGELKGEVFDENKENKFMFSGSFTDGRFTGTHAAEGDNGPNQLGTLTLAR